MEYTFWPAIRFDNSFLLVIGFGGGCVLASYLTVQVAVLGVSNLGNRTCKRVLFYPMTDRLTEVIEALHSQSRRVVPDTSCCYLDSLIRFVVNEGSLLIHTVLEHSMIFSPNGFQGFPLIPAPLMAIFRHHLSFSFKQFQGSTG